MWEKIDRRGENTYIATKQPNVIQVSLEWFGVFWLEGFQESEK